MFHFLDDDTDMYNTPYTYNAGRTGFLACNEYFRPCNAWKKFALFFFFFLPLFECMSSVYTIRRMLFSSFLTACITKRLIFFMEMRTNTALTHSFLLLVYFGP